MERVLLNELVERGLTLDEMSLETGKSKTSIRYWLKKFDLKTKRASNKDNKLPPTGTKLCPKCGVEKDVDEFYKRRNGLDITSYCKICTKKQTIDRQRDFKKQCILYKGGCCQKCGYNKCDSALEFHHLDPNEKDFSIAHIRLTKFGDKAKKELDKCIMVCANCHREIHANQYEIF